MVDKTKTYSLNQLKKLKAFPIKESSFTAYKNVVMRDRDGMNILKAEVRGEGPATRIYIKGSNVLKYQKRCSTKPVPMIN